MEAVVVVAVAVEAAVMLPAWISKFSRTLMSCPLDGVLLYCRKCPIQGYENPSERPKPRKKTVTQLSCKLFLTDYMCGLHVAGKIGAGGGIGHIARIGAGGGIGHIARIGAGGGIGHIARIGAGGGIGHIARIGAGGGIGHIVRIGAGSGIGHITRIGAGGGSGSWGEDRGYVCLLSSG
ncbi:hypothetical protein RRG08_021471 [Elysia crispata]|uniref:Uncharacterized protein n=1 Tax=Elysia crispata TaxID=231223 RepID=A0AAE1AEH7_9GAST|nr:hypothetical protein RRG08_021471 [Elysia crispata]